MPKTLAFAFAALGLAASLGGAAAEATSNRAISVEPGKPVRVQTITALKNDCSNGEVGSIRIITSPKNGTFAIRSDEVTTPSNFRCSNKRTKAQVLFYESKRNFEGTEDVSFETRNADGVLQIVNVKISVSKKGQGRGSSGIQDL